LSQGCSGVRVAAFAGETENGHQLTGRVEFGLRPGFAEEPAMGGDTNERCGYSSAGPVRFNRIRQRGFEVRLLIPQLVESRRATRPKTEGELHQHMLPGGTVADRMGAVLTVPEREALERLGSVSTGTSQEERRDQDEQHAHHTEGRAQDPACSRVGH
jgi:hypothetical protein